VKIKSDAPSFLNQENSDPLLPLKSKKRSPLTVKQKSDRPLTVKIKSDAPSFLNQENSEPLLPLKSKKRSPLTVKQKSDRRSMIISLLSV
jgi:hypothetical protein